MKTKALLALVAGLCLAACGGLKHVPNVKTEPAWRELPVVATTQPLPAGKNIAPPPTEVPLKKIDVRGAYVAVFDIRDKSKKLKPMEIDGLTEYLANKVAEGGLFHVVPRSEIKKRLQKQKKDSFRKCYDQSCQIEIGREIAAQKTLTVTIAPIGSSCVVTAALFDLKKAATDATASSRGKCSADDLVAQLEEVIDKFRRMAK